VEDTPPPPPPPAAVPATAAPQQRDLRDSVNSGRASLGPNKRGAGGLTSSSAAAAKRAAAPAPKAGANLSAYRLPGTVGPPPSGNRAGSRDRDGCVACHVPPACPPPPVSSLAPLALSPPPPL
jgi:hypothetical protein